MTDRKFLRIVEGAIKGEQDSFDELMRLRGKNILYIALNLMRNQSDGEDAAQDAIIRIRKDIGKLRQPGAFDTWMYRVVYNTCMDAKKKMKRTVANIDPDASEMVLEDREEFLPEEFVHNEEKRSELIEAIKELPENYRMCLLMYYYQDMSYHDIADVMDMSVQDVANNLNRGKKKLRATLLPIDNFVGSDEEEKASKKAGFVALPVLAQVFALDEQMSITPTMMNAVLSGAGVATLGASGGSTGAASSSSATSHIGIAAKPLAGIASKVAIGVAAVATATAVGVGAYTVFTSDPEPEVPITQGQQNGSESDGAIGSDSTDEKDTGTDEESTEKDANEEKVTPEAIIGSSGASTLNSYTTQERDQSQWNEFVTETQLLYTGETVDSSYRYTLYYLDDASTNARLMVVERLDNNGKVLVAYSTGKTADVLPNRSEIIAAYNKWR